MRQIASVVSILSCLTRAWVLFIVLGQAGKDRQTNLKNYQNNTGQSQS